jgi:hypothetical protein
MLEVTVDRVAIEEAEAERPFKGPERYRKNQ